MSIIFNPTGSLDIATESSDLPETSDGINMQSGAMVRCKNLCTDRNGMAITRRGSSKINSTAIDTDIRLIIEQSGNRFEFTGDKIYKNETSIATGLTEADWTGIKYKSFNDTTEQIFATNGTDKKRIESGVVYEWGIDAPTVAPTIAAGAGGGLTGLYNAKYTYVRKSGDTVLCESNASDAATAAVELFNQSLAITVTQPTDSQVTHIRLYRTLTGGSIYYYDQEIAISVSYDYGASHQWEIDGEYITGTGYLFTESDDTNTTDNCFGWEELYDDRNQSTADQVLTQPWGDFETIVSDGSLGAQLHTDHNRIGSSQFVFGPAYNGVSFALIDNNLYYSLSKQPEYWPTNYFIEVSSPDAPGIAGCFHNGQPYVFTKDQIYYIQGTGHLTFFPLPMNAKTGVQSKFGLAPVKGFGIFHIGDDGIYLFSQGDDKKLTESALDPIFRGETVEGLPGVSNLANSWLLNYGNKLYFGYPTTGTYPDTIIRFNLDNNRLIHIDYGQTFRAVSTDDTNNRILAGDTSGFVWHIEKTTATDDAGTAISYDIKSKDFTLQTRAHFPRWVKYDVDIVSGSCTGSVILDGVTHQNHTLTGSRNTKRRLVTTGNGEREALQVSGSGQVKIYLIEAE